MHTLSPFHLAIPVDDLASCRTFYRDTLGCKEGRSSDHWVDFNFFGHQLVIHLKQDSQPKAPTNTVDGKRFLFLILVSCLIWILSMSWQNNFKKKTSSLS